MLNAAKRQKSTLYQQEKLIESAKNILYQHAFRNNENHTLPAGYAIGKGKIHTACESVSLDC